MTRGYARGQRDDRKDGRGDRGMTRWTGEVTRYELKDGRGNRERNEGWGREPMDRKGNRWRT